MIIYFEDAPDVDTDLIDTIHLTSEQQQLLNDNLLELL